MQKRNYTREDTSRRGFRLICQYKSLENTGFDALLRLTQICIARTSPIMTVKLRRMEMDRVRLDKAPSLPQRSV